MTQTELLEVVAAAVVPVALVLLTLGWFRRGRRDEVFHGITPGEVPALGQQATTERVSWRDAEWSGPVSVRFTPPDGVTPGLMGTVIDGSADAVDVSATLVDLAVRGYVHLHAEPVTADTPKPPPPPPGMPRRASAAQRTSSSGHPPSSGHDWRMTRLAPPAGGTLLPFERELLNKIFTRSREVTVAELKARGFDLTMREAQIGLYREVVDRGYYTKHPRDRNRRLGCLGIPLLLLAVGAGIAGITAGTTDFTGKLSAALGVGLGLSALLLLWGGRGRTPRTAVGSAVRIQALGFREYLTKAEANQIRFEEATDLFSRYLPYAMVFGVADRWARVFADVARSAQLRGIGDAYFDLTWIDGFDALGNVLGAGFDALQLGDAIGGLGDIDFGLVDADIGDGLSAVTDGAGDFLSSASDLLDFGDGCGCDGCDLGF